MNETPDWSHDRREFLRVTGGASLATLLATRSLSADSVEEEKRSSLGGVVGITTGGGLGQQQRRGKLSLLTLPRYMRDELGMRLIDVNTTWFDTFDEGFLRRVREAADAADCFYTNLKVNDPVSGVLYSDDSVKRRQANAKCRNLIDAAKVLGTRWIRFTVPKAAAEDPVAHRELAVYAQQQGIQLLVENTGWLGKDARSIPSLVKAIGDNVAPCPDTGNWDDDVRWQGLRNSFPGAVSCDFKVWELDAQQRHARYDLKRCFDIGWNAGFRGPWVIELMQDDAKFARNAVYIRDLLHVWIKQRSQQGALKQSR